MTAEATSTSPEPALSTEDRASVRPLGGPAFGRDAEGRRLAHGNGRPVVGAMRLFLSTVEDKAERTAPGDLPPADLGRHVDRARRVAIGRLLAMLNASVTDERQQLTEEMLFDERVNYTYEFWAVLLDYMAYLTDEPDLVDRIGAHMIPRSIVQLARPLGISRTFAAVGRFASMFTHTDLRPSQLTREGAVVRWYGRPMLEQVPLENRRRYLLNACRTYRSTLSAVPSTIFGQSPASVKNVVCMDDGAEYCEWRFAWRASEDRLRVRELVLGGIATTLIILAAVLRMPFWDVIAVAAAAVLPIALVLYGSRLRSVAERLRHQNAMLEEQRNASEREFARSEVARQELQIANVDLRRGLAELSALHEVGQALGATLDIGALLDRSLRAVTRNLHYERALVLLADESGRFLGHARSVGGSGEAAEVVAALRIPLNDQGSLMCQVYHGDGPMAVDDVGLHPDEDTRQMAEALRVDSLLAVPLLSKGRRIGVLAVDRGISGATVDPADGTLLMTAGTAIASAIETARLYAAVEQQNRELEARVEERTRDLETTMASAEAARDRAEIQAQQIEHLVTISPVATVAVDEPDMRVTRWNPAAERLFGWTATEAVGRVLNDLIAPGELREEADRLDHGEIDESFVRLITKRARKDGTLVDVSLLAAPIVIEERRIGGIAIYHDITELQRARAAADEARAAAEEANRSKSAFLAMMSHEIRTPMNAVIGMSGLLLDTPLNAEQRDYAETIRTSGDALLTIINDILDFSKIEAGRMELEQAPFDLAECVEGALDLIAPVAARKGLELAYVVDGELPPAIVGDVGRLRQVVLNLLGNAIKFTEQGEIELRAAAAPLPDGRRQVRLTVRDTGVGISPSAMSRLFQSFSQADASTSRRFGGTGLGLAISRRLVELMGGTVTVESPGVGLGSTFVVEFPAAAAEGASTKRSRLDRLPELAGRRVLVVDDNGTNRRILEAQLGAWGMATHSTGSPLEGLRWVRGGEPLDLAVLDLQMPDMDGAALARAVREARGGRLPVILVSSVGQRDERVRSASPEAFLTKPVKPSELLDAVVTALQAEALSSGAAVPVPAPTAPDAAAAPADRATTTDASPIRLLLAEDNAVNQKVAMRMLAKLGYRADIAANGREVLEALDRQPYDAVLMDVQMPEMDGLEATRRIRARGPNGKPHIIAMTANAMTGDRELCLEAGMNDYISKPVRESELAAALARAAVEAAAS